MHKRNKIILARIYLIINFYVNQSLSLCIKAYVKKYFSPTSWNGERSRDFL